MDTYISNIKSNNTSVLDLSNNKLEPNDAIKLATVLSLNTSIHTLNLCNNNIGDAGATAIAQALTQNQTIKHCLLFNNDIHMSGATAIAEMLNTNRSLNLLDIGYNDIGLDAATKIINLISNNTTMRTLLMCGVGLVRYVEVIDNTNLIESNHTLTELFLGKYTDKIDEFLARNKSLINH